MGSKEGKNPVSRRSVFRGTFLFKNVIWSKRDIEKVSWIYVIGTVPHVAGGKPAIKDGDCGELRESLTRICANLSFFFYKPDQKVIGIHSVKPGVGKSFFSVCLATCFALNGKKVLLIGANLRRPGLNPQAGKERAPGLSSYLSGQPFDACVRKTGPGELWMMPEGPAVENPGELLNNDLFKRLIRQSRETFDYVILDNAPASVVADGLITGAACDLNLFVLRTGVSRKNEFRFIDQLTGAGSMSHLALVLNGQ